MEGEEEPVSSTAAEDERASIVAHLRAIAAGLHNQAFDEARNADEEADFLSQCKAYQDAANGVERGDHLK